MQGLTKSYRSKGIGENCPTESREADTDFRGNGFGGFFVLLFSSFLSLTVMKMVRDIGGPRTLG